MELRDKHFPWQLPPTAHANPVAASLGSTKCIGCHATGSDFIHEKVHIGNDGQPDSYTIAAILYPGGMADGEPENPLVVSDS